MGNDQRYQSETEEAVLAVALELAAKTWKVALHDGRRERPALHTVEQPQAASRLQAVLALIDQQQYLQGWAPIAFMAMHIRYGLTLAADILTGPAVVDKSNIDKLVDASKEGIR